MNKVLRNLRIYKIYSLIYTNNSLKMYFQYMNNHILYNTIILCHFIRMYIKKGNDFILLSFLGVSRW